MSAHGPESHIVATTPFDPFTPPIIQVKVHKIRFILIEGLDSNPYIDVKAVLKQLKKSLGCGGMLMNDSEAASGGGGGESIVLCGDQRAQVERFLVDEEQGLGISRRFVQVVVEAAEKTRAAAAAASTPRIRKQKKIKSTMDLQDLMRLGNV